MNGLWTSFKGFLIPGFALALCACAYTRPHFTSLDYSPEGMDIVGPACGSARDYYLLGMGPIGRGKIGFANRAMEAALQSAKADALINVVADEMTDVSFLWIIYNREVRICGTAVRFRKRPA